MNPTTTTDLSLDELRAEKARLDELFRAKEREEADRRRREEKKAEQIAKVAPRVASFRKQADLFLSIATAIKAKGGPEMRVYQTASALGEGLPTDERLSEYYLAQIDRDGYCSEVGIRIEEVSPSGARVSVSYVSRSGVEVYGPYTSRPRIYRPGKNGFNVAGIAAAYIEERSLAAERLAHKQREEGRKAAIANTISEVLANVPAPATEGPGKGNFVSLRPSSYGSSLSVTLTAFPLSPEKAADLLSALSTLGFTVSRG
jgi:hypothetical protein